jgi:hypothetical protein
VIFFNREEKNRKPFLFAPKNIKNKSDITVQRFNARERFSRIFKKCSQEKLQEGKRLQILSELPQFGQPRENKEALSTCKLADSAIGVALKSFRSPWSS